MHTLTHVNVVARTEINEEQREFIEERGLDSAEELVMQAVKQQLFDEADEIPILHVNLSIEED